MRRTPVSESDALRQRFEAAMMPNYGTPPLAIARGEGSRVIDPDGNSYLDLIAGIAVSSLGHAHPAIVEAVARQVAAVAHTSNLFVHEPGVALAERLLGLLKAEGKVFFCNSGAEANEAALKIVRRCQGTDKPVVAAIGSFHGRTMGALSITGKESIRTPFGPFGTDVRWIPYGDEKALAEAVTSDVAAVFLEPTLGEGGVVAPPAGYLRAVRKACDEAGALFVLDEVQSGIGRTGEWFAHQKEGVLPDVLTLAKGLGGGLPIGAVIGFGETGTALRPGDHGTTYGGNPVASAAALAVLDTIENEGLLDNVKTVGAKLIDGLAAIDHPLANGVRGSGLWLAVPLAEPKSAAVRAAAQSQGFLVNPVQPDVIRLAPPLILTDAEAGEFLTAFPAILNEAAQA
ncbi:MAG: acetylornithine transaminase [Streptosporangiales bacterium]|jgi:acetylornithine aminotransferase|nr:acetylornithine transaminase [Streptosporangiales bacterium]